MPMPDIDATPMQSELHKKTRVLIVYGSESGNAKRGIGRWVKKWEGACAEIISCPHPSLSSPLVLIFRGSS